MADDETEVRSFEGVPRPAAPRTAIGRLVARYLGPVRRAGRGVLPDGTPGGEAVVPARADFSGSERLVVPGGQVLDRAEDDVVTRVFSMSYSAPRLFGARPEDFEADLRRLLRTASPTGLFSERQPGTEVHVWRTWFRERPVRSGRPPYSMIVPNRATAPPAATPAAMRASGTRCVLR